MLDLPSFAPGEVTWGIGHSAFTGLRRCGSNAALCSTRGWWAAVGQSNLHEGGIPAWPDESAGTGKFIADTAELFIYSQEATTTTTTTTTVVPEATVAAPELVIAVSAASGRDIEKIPVAANVGDQVFTDRNYKFTSVGDYSGCTYIKGANDDKNTAASSTQWTLTVGMPVTVYLDFWGGAAHENLGFAQWQAGWVKASKAGVRFGTSPHFWGPGAVYQKDFPAGTIELEGNQGNGHGTYVAFVCPKETTVTINTSMNPPIARNSASCTSKGFNALSSLVPSVAKPSCIATASVA